VALEIFGWKMASRKTPLKKTKSRSTSPGKGSRKVPRKSHTQNALTAGEWFERLVALQARLRAPNGCPWDREQTHATLRTYLIEEAYEVLDAMKSGDDAKFANEMGDLLLQVVFHSQIATEEGRFTVADVIREVHEKMVRRHPHVFGEKRAKDAAEVLRNWEQIKAQERKGEEKQQGNGTAKAEEKPKSLLDGVPRGLPATMEGLQLTRKASRAGFDWENAEGVFEKLREELAELRLASERKDPARMEEEMGDLLFAAVNLARFLQVDPEIALKNANAKFARRFRQMERLSADKGQSFAEVPRAEKEKLWETAKRREKESGKTEAVGKR
jgi:MazG family protein